MEKDFISVIPMPAVPVDVVKVLRCSVTQLSSIFYIQKVLVYLGNPDSYQDQVCDKKTFPY